MRYTQELGRKVSEQRKARVERLIKEAEARWSVTMQGGGALYRPGVLGVHYTFARLPHGMNIVPNAMSPKTTVCRTSPVRVGHPRTAIAAPNREDVSLYMKGDATRRKMREDKTEIHALADTVGSFAGIV
jgi:hypothetical protein